MDLAIPDEVHDFAASAKSALADPGLARLRRSMAGELELRNETLEALGALGLDDFDENASHTASLAAAHLALEAGAVAAPAPIPAMLAARLTGLDGMVQAIDDPGGRPLVNHADLLEPVAVVTPSGAVHPVTAVRRLDPPVLLAPFASVVETGPSRHESRRTWELYEVLSAFSSIGSIRVIAELCRTYAGQRVQFGKPLKAFQAIQHRYVDIRVAYASLWELAHYTLWRLFSAPDDSFVDVLGLRIAHIEAIRLTTSNSHQLHGSIGFTDEYDLSMYTRAIQLSHYSPTTLDRSIDLLAGRIEEFTTLYPLGDERPVLSGQGRNGG